MTLVSSTTRIKGSAGRPNHLHRFPGPLRMPAQARIETKLDALNQIAYSLTPGPDGAKGIRYTIEFDCDCLP